MADLKRPANYNVIGTSLTSTTTKLQQPAGYSVYFRSAPKNEGVYLIARFSHAFRVVPEEGRRAKDSFLRLRSR